MATNSLYPGFIRLFYTGSGHPHVQVLPVKPFVAIGGAWFVELYGNPAGGLWTDSVDEYVDVLKPFMDDVDSVTRAELWTMASPTADPLFVDGYDVSVSGTAAGASILYGQQTLTFRSDLGGVYRNVLMEGVNPPNIEQFPPFGSILGALVSFLTGGGSFVYARDGGELIVPIRLLTKTNDTLRKKYLLDA